MTAGTLDILRAVEPYYFDAWRMAGPHNARARAVLMARILNVPKVPQARAGVTELQKALRALAPASVFAGTECEAQRERHFRDWARAQLATV